MIMEHYLIVKEWRQNFDPHTDKTENVIVSVKLPDPPIEYYDHSFLFKVGGKIGNPILCFIIYSLFYTSSKSLSTIL